MTLWYMFNDKDFEYEVDWKDLKFAFEQIFKKDCKGLKTTNASRLKDL